MKPTILHLIGDKRAGGSNYLVNKLVTSRLKEDFNFVVLRLQEAKLQLKTLKPDLIIFHYPCTWKYLLDLCKLKMHSKIIIYDHHYCQGFENNQVSSRFRFRWMLRLAYLLADKVVSVSHAQSKWMKDNQLVNPAKVDVIQPASIIDELLKIPVKEIDRPLKIGAYGRFAPQKGFDILLKALALVPQEQFHLYLGGYGADEALIYELAQELPHVTLMGTITDVVGFLSNCDLVVIPSRWEPWGLVCLESKAAGKPVIAAAIDGLCEQVENCGLLVKPCEPRAFADAFNSLERKKLIQWGQRGRELVQNKWDEFLDLWKFYIWQTLKE